MFVLKNSMLAKFVGEYEVQFRSDRTVKDIIEVLEKNGVSKAALFGSYARGEATEESDIDLLIEFSGRRSLLDLAGLKIELQEHLGRDVDLLTYDSLHPLLRDHILAEQVILYD